MRSSDDTIRRQQQILRGPPSRSPFERNLSCGINLGGVRSPCQCSNSSISSLSISVSPRARARLPLRPEVIDCEQKQSDALRLLLQFQQHLRCSPECTEHIKMSACATLISSEISLAPCFFSCSTAPETSSDVQRHVMQALAAFARLRHGDRQPSVPAVPGGCRQRSTWQHAPFRLRHSSSPVHFKPEAFVKLPWLRQRLHRDGQHDRSKTTWSTSGRSALPSFGDLPDHLF